MDERSKEPSRRPEKAGSPGETEILEDDALEKVSGGCIVIVPCPKD